MVSFNKVVVAGNLTRDPELRFTNGGVPVCGFGLAVNRVRSKNEEVDFFDISAWRELGETIANYKKKGDPVLIEGRLQFRSWEAQDGTKRNKVDIVAENVQFLGGKPEGNGGGARGSSAGGGTAQGAGHGRQQEQEVNEEDFDDIPFAQDPRAKTRVVSNIL
ncbi:MAG: single-stranded DNA-binding protein [Rubrobacteraceae bacterium]